MLVLVDSVVLDHQRDFVGQVCGKLDVTANSRLLVRAVTATFRRLLDRPIYCRGRDLVTYRNLGTRVALLVAVEVERSFPSIGHRTRRS